MKTLVPLIAPLIRYLLVAGIFYFIYYIWKRRSWMNMKIQEAFPDKHHMIRDILYSISTSLIFGMMGLGIWYAFGKGYTFIYKDISQYGYTYVFLMPIVLLFIHDTYFYWTHRFMHKPSVFRIVHRVHHLSHNPTPWTAFAFHPLEALIEAAFFPILVFLIPLHPVSIALFMLAMMVMNVLGHAGYEFTPRKFFSHPIGKFQNTPTHHNMHHQLGRGNYGLYFNFWDRWLGTNHEHYEKTFNRIAEKRDSV